MHDTEAENMLYFALYWRVEEAYFFETIHKDARYKVYSINMTLINDGFTGTA